MNGGLINAQNVNTITIEDSNFLLVNAVNNGSLVYSEDLTGSITLSNL